MQQPKEHRMKIEELRRISPDNKYPNLHMVRQDISDFNYAYACRTLKVVNVAFTG